MLFLQLGVHEVERLAELFRAVFEGLFKQVSCTFEFLAAVTLNKLREVNIPDLESDGEVEQFDSPFVHLETFLKVLVLFQERGIIDNDLGVGDFQLHDLVVHCLG